jgi:hypothetical protein
LVDVAVVLDPSAGAVITTLGATPLTLIVAVLPVPKALAQTTEMAFGPATKVLEFVPGVVVALPLIVQVVPPGIVDAPSTV